LRFFIGLGHQEAAEIMGITRGAADGLWAYARKRLVEAQAGSCFVCFGDSGCWRLS
jgi:hypothetical protein